MPSLSHQEILFRYVLHNQYGVEPDTLSAAGLRYQGRVLTYPQEDSVLAVWYPDESLVLLKSPWAVSSQSAYRKLREIRLQIHHPYDSRFRAIDVPVPDDPPNHRNIGYFQREVSEFLRRRVEFPLLLHSKEVPHLGRFVDAYIYSQRFGIPTQSILTDIPPSQQSMALALWWLYSHELSPNHPDTDVCLEFLQRYRFYLVHRWLFLEHHGSRSSVRGTVWDLLDACFDYIRPLDLADPTVPVAVMLHLLFTSRYEACARYDSQPVTVYYRLETDSVQIIESARRDFHLGWLRDSSMVGVIASWECPVCGRLHQQLVPLTPDYGVTPLRQPRCHYVLDYLRSNPNYGIYRRLVDPPSIENPLARLRAISDRSSLEKTRKHLGLAALSGYCEHYTYVFVQQPTFHGRP